MLIYNSIESGQKFQERIQITTKKGNNFYVLFSGKSIYKKDEIVSIVGTVQNIDKQVKSENRLKDNEKLLHTLIDSLPLNLYIKDKDLKKILVNKSHSDYLGVEHPNDLIGQSNNKYFDDVTNKLLQEQDLHVLKTQQPILAKEEIITKKDGTSAPFLISKVPLKDSKNKVYALLGISVNISNIKEKEKELKQLIDITAIQNKKLSNFAHITSHNLRSHSANFSMLLHFLAKENNKKEKENILAMLIASSENLLKTLDDLNEVIKINENINLNRTNININTSLENVCKSLSLFFKKNKVVLKKNIAKNAQIAGISDYVESIILNLLTNAVKYKHPDRKPEITVNAEKEGDKIVLSVIDNGMGIDLRKNRDKLFGMYKTFHNNEDARGIGLYVTKHQIEAMGGSITADSKVNKGSIFKVYFNEKY